MLDKHVTSNLQCDWVQYRSPTKRVSCAPSSYRAARLENCPALLCLVALLYGQWPAEIALELVTAVYGRLPMACDEDRPIGGDLHWRRFYSVQNKEDVLALSSTWKSNVRFEYNLN